MNIEVEEPRLIAALLDLDFLLSADLWKPSSSKSATESSRARKEGNTLYTAKSDQHNEANHMEALKLYTRAVAHGPPGSEELGLAYGNRSALLVHLGRYHEAIQDLDRALWLPLPELHWAKYLCRKVECQAELGMQEAKNTCEEAKGVLQELDASDEVKKGIIVKLVKAIVKLEKCEYKGQQIKRKVEIPSAEKLERHKSSENPNASDALVVSRGGKYSARYGRHLTATRDIAPGEILYRGEAYAAFPIEAHLYTNCSHCLRYTWAGLPCDYCSYAIYCSEECRREARELYHDVECKIIHKAWKSYERMNSGRMLCVRLLVMAMKEAGGLPQLRQSLEDIDACKDYRRRGFSNDQTVFINNHRSVYSLLAHANKKFDKELKTVSEDSAVLLYLLTRYTTLFRRYFDYDKKALARSEDALFVGKLLSHYQHLVLINAISVKDAYSIASTDWNWTIPKEENCTGIYMIPFLSLLNHSCYPNVARCECEDRRTILYATRPITKGEQIFECYGPTYAEMTLSKRQELLSQFYFICKCEACENKWPMFMHMIGSGLTFSTMSYSEIDATTKALCKCDKILESMKEGTFNYDPEAVQDVAYAIVLTIKQCKLPNWRLPSLAEMLGSIFNEIYGYVINIPDKC